MMQLISYIMHSFPVQLTLPQPWMLMPYQKYLAGHVVFCQHGAVRLQPLVAAYPPEE